MTSTARYAEDIEGNLRLVEELAPTHCIACGGYHLSRARKRLRPDHVDMLDRSHIIGLVREHALRWLAASTGNLHLLIAGNADTNLLSTCAEALSEIDPGLGRLRCTAIDSCQTPLEVCKAYAHRHAIDLRTERVDMTDPKADFAANLILVHSLLRFAPVDSHLGIMRRLASWLQDDGAIIFSHRLMPARADDTDSVYVTEYQTSQQLRTLFGEAGLRTISLRQFEESKGRGRKRVLAVLSTG
jgi:hypothetical protein